jgi:hypothetical protein
MSTAIRDSVLRARQVLKEEFPHLLGPMSDVNFDWLKAEMDRAARRIAEHEEIMLRGQDH